MSFVAEKEKKQKKVPYEQSPQTSLKTTTNNKTTTTTARESEWSLSAGAGAKVLFQVHWRQLSSKPSRAGTLVFFFCVRRWLEPDLVSAAAAGSHGPTVWYCLMTYSSLILLSLCLIYNSFDLKFHSFSKMFQSGAFRCPSAEVSPFLFFVWPSFVADYYSFMQPPCRVIVVFWGQTVFGCRRFNQLKWAGVSAGTREWQIEHRTPATRRKYRHFCSYFLFLKNIHSCDLYQTAPNPEDDWRHTRCLQK